MQFEIQGTYGYLIKLLDWIWQAIIIMIAILLPYGTTLKINSKIILEKNKIKFAFFFQKNMSKPLKTDVIDSSSGIIFPFYDIDSNVMFLAGKVWNISFKNIDI